MRMIRGCVALLFGLGCVACGGHDTGHGGNGHESHDTVAVAEPEHGLMLDGEQKWEMDNHTRTVFATMDGLWVEYDAEIADDEVRRRTGSALRTDIDDLIAGCTMQGPAHEELHKFLMVYIPAVDDLASSGTPESAVQVRELLEIYPVYFK